MSETNQAADQVVNIKELKKLKKNPRKHDKRNLDMIETSLREVGAFRSIAIDETNTAIAGNGTLTAAERAGIKKVRIIDAGPDELIAVRRSDMTQEQKDRAAILDNRTNETSEWDTKVLGKMAADGTKLDDLWGTDELTEILPPPDMRQTLSYLKPQGDDEDADEGFGEPDDGFSSQENDEVGAGEEDDEDGSADGAKPKSNGPLFPLTIVLDRNQKREWDAIKKELGVVTDTPAFLKLMQGRATKEQE